jgi:protein-disulfide isomerase-like protein with CxxC motif
MAFLQEPHQTHQPMFRIPFVVMATAVVLALAYLGWAFAPANIANLVLADFAFWPARYSAAYLAAQETGALIPFARAAFETYWSELKDVSQREVLEEVCRKANLDPAAILARSEAADIKDRLKANTEEVIARGGFGSPTMFVNTTDMYFGNDRLPLVREALARRTERAA